MSKKDDDLIDTIKKRFQSCVDNDSMNRKEWLEDMKFAHIPGSQWPDDLRALREDPTSPRPCLEINVTAQHVFQVTNDIRQNRPTVKVRPVSMDASTDVAEVFDGVIRHIDACSDGDVATDVAVNGQVTGGFGYFRILTKIVNKETNEQELEIKPIHNPLSVYLDDMALCPVGSDANDCFVIDDMPKKQFEADYGELKDEWSDAGTGDDIAWTTKTSVRVAEYFERAEKSVNLLILMDGSEIEEGKYWEQWKGDVMRPAVIDNKTETTKYVKWTKLTSFKILERGEIPCEWIPVIRVPGIITDIEGKRYYKGLVRDAKDPQRTYNYQWSTFVETVALQPKVPFMVVEGQIEDYENEWLTANTSNRPFLRYRQTDVEGRPAPPPQRQALQMSPQGVTEGLMMANDAIKMVTGQYDASLGQKSNETSGKAIMARQREGDTATYHFVDHVSMAIRQKGRILVAWIPKIYDQRRVARILGEDGSTQEAKLDPQQPMPVRETKQRNGAIEKIYNLNVGRYDVLATVGPSYTTKRAEAVEAMAQIMQANPQIFPIIGDIWVRNQDWPGADEIAERLKIMAPPQVQQAEQAENGGQPIPPQVQAQMQQMQAQMQQMSQALQMAQGKLQEFQAKDQAKEADIKIKQMDVFMKQMDVRIKEIEAETKTQEAQLKAEQAHAENIRSFAAASQPVQQQPVPAQ